MSATSIKATLHLLFQGTGADALAFYEKIFPSLTLIGKTHREDGSLETARFELGGLRVQFIMIPINMPLASRQRPHYFWIDNAEQQADLVKHLSEGGKTLMPLDNHGFSQAFAWVGIALVFPADKLALVLGLTTT